MAILVLAEHDHRSISPATLNTCSAAKALAALTGGDVAVLVAGENCGGAARDAAGATSAGLRRAGLGFGVLAIHQGQR